MTRLPRAAVLLLPFALAACTSSAAPAAAPVVTTTAATATTAPPATTTTTTTANPTAAADHAICAQFDTGTADLAALVTQIAAGTFTPKQAPAITIGKADIAMRAAVAKAPTGSGVAPDITTLAGAIEDLGKVVATPDANGTVHVGYELDAVQLDWRHVIQDCNRAGYALKNTIK